MDNTVSTSFKSSSIGLLFGALGCILLIWNEYVSMELLSTSRRMERSVVAADSVVIKNSGKLVYVTGPLKSTSSEIPKDDLFGVSEPNAVVLKRLVEMYQWEEEDSSVEYTEGWSTKVIDSSDYPDDKQNPTSFPYDPLFWGAENLALLDFSVSSNVTKRITWFQAIRTPLRKDTIPDETIRNKAKLVGDGFYFGDDAAYPKIGDYRIYFKAIYSMETISMIAKQQSDGSLDEIVVIQPGHHSIQDLLAFKHRIPVVRNWIVRCVAWILFAVCLAMSSQYLPGLVEYSGWMPTLVLATLTTALLCSLTWMAYNPLLSILTLAAIGGSFYKLKEFVESGRSHYMPAALSENFAELTRPQFMELNTI